MSNTLMYKRIIIKSVLKSFSAMNKKYKVLVTRCGVPESALAIMRDKCDMEIWHEKRLLSKSELLEKVVGKYGLFVTQYDKIDADILNAAGESLKIISTMVAGYDHVDINEAKKRKIKLGFTPNVQSDAVAELTIAILLSCTRRLFEVKEQLAKGYWETWQPWNWMSGTCLKGCAVGIIGLGGIDLEVAKRLQPFKVKEILYVSRSKKEGAECVNAVKVDLTTLLKKSDIIIITCALTEKARNLLGYKEFELMRKNAIIVNMSRGEVIHQDSLVRALKEKRIKGAALDVMTPEPLPTDHELL